MSVGSALQLFPGALGPNIRPFLGLFGVAVVLGHQFHERPEVLDDIDTPTARSDCSPPPRFPSRKVTSQESSVGTHTAKILFSHTWGQRFSTSTLRIRKMSPGRAITDGDRRTAGHHASPGPASPRVTRTGVTDEYMRTREGRRARLTHARTPDDHHPRPPSNPPHQQGTPRRPRARGTGRRSCRGSDGPGRSGPGSARPIHPTGLRHPSHVARSGPGPAPFQPGTIPSGCSGRKERSSSIGPHRWALNSSSSSAGTHSSRIVLPPACCTG